MTICVLPEGHEPIPEKVKPQERGKTVPKLEKITFSAQDLQRFCPTPGRRLENKFRWFYKPYNYQTNTHKYMDFSSSSDDSETAYEPPLYQTLPCSPWTNERPENKKRHKLFIEKYLKKELNSMSWRQVYHFMEKMGVG